MTLETFEMLAGPEIDGGSGDLRPMLGEMSPLLSNGDETLWKIKARLFA